MKRIRENHKKWAHHKKELHRRRKNKRKVSFVPKIVADTNIWYYLGDSEYLFGELKKAISPNLCNIMGTLPYRSINKQSFKSA